MPEWVIEQGIGEIRALLLDGDEVLSAKLHWPGELFAGQMLPARLTSRNAGSQRGTAETANGTQVLLDRIHRDVAEGSMVEVAVTRAAIAEKGRLKLAQGRVTDGKLQGQTSPFEGLNAREVRNFPKGIWEEVWETASSGQIDFAAGALIFSVTPAMTLIDVDGNLPPRELAIKAIPAIARGLRQFDLAGSIGIDFPTLEARADRKAVDEELGEALADWPHERTAMNGFGFVQIIARMEGPSLLHRFAASRVGMCARMALRRGEMAEGHGPAVLLTVHPALKPKLKPAWLDELARRSGREVRIVCDPSLALEAAQAQILSA